MNHLPHTCRMSGRHNREQDAGSFGGCSSSSIQHHGCLPGSRPAFANQGLALLPSSIFCFFLFGFTVSMKLAFMAHFKCLRITDCSCFCLPVSSCSSLWSSSLKDSFVVAPNLLSQEIVTKLRPKENERF